MEKRTFQMDGQWNIVYYPFQPNGFAILLIGDQNHYVEEENSYWLQHPGRLDMLEHLKASGYTIFSSNLYGQNWGCEKAVELDEGLYQRIMKSEILNKKVHLLAEGTGALTAVKLLARMGGQIRSAVLINPTLSLKSQLLKQKENKFFYKKWLREVAAAYEVKPEDMEQKILNTNEMTLETEVPMKIIHVLGNNDYNQSDLYKELLMQEQKNEITYLVPEKRYKIPSQIQQFFKRFEESL